AAEAATVDPASRPVSTKMACGIVPATWSLLGSTTARRAAAGAGGDDVGPGRGAEHLARLTARPIATELPGFGASGIHVGRDAAGSGRQLLAQPTQLQDLIAERGRSLEFEVAGRLLHLRLQPAHHGCQLFRLLAGHLQLGPLLS